MIYAEGGWRLLKNPDPRWGLVICHNGIEKKIPASDFALKSYNEMAVVVPAGAEKLEIFANWNRGWKWRSLDQVNLLPTKKGSRGGIEINFKSALATPAKIALIYDPSPPRWVFWVLVFGFIGTAGAWTSWPPRAP